MKAGINRILVKPAEEIKEILGIVLSSSKAVSHEVIPIKGTVIDVGVKCDFGKINLSSNKVISSYKRYMIRLQNEIGGPSDIKVGDVIYFPYTIMIGNEDSDILSIRQSDVVAKEHFGKIVGVNGWVMLMPSGKVGDYDVYEFDGKKVLAFNAINMNVSSFYDTNQQVIRCRRENIVAFQCN